ncbi:uncharacterized protein MKK02DRAFT_44852 [Dioszegia hungarica]|uniref:Uncharacterized protein n=1 Tax=Dioszegia hungarica TaxID=4972 RepID=A0AA38LV64_9TREE|nr:uncharacterized protein MKK02DRAFT_44852 [Dioszegia hungarica]KAI9636148.1 hypothetical protein MKK02DRAFT_44852 [Dioszegia hungarica]
MLSRTSSRLLGLRMATQTQRSRGYASSSEQIREFFHARPVPVEIYPLLAMTFVMCSFAGYHLTRHITKDREHLRWKPTGHHAMAYSRVNEHAGSHFLGGTHH